MAMFGGDEDGDVWQKLAANNGDHQVWQPLMASARPLEPDYPERRVRRAASARFETKWTPRDFLVRLSCTTLNSWSNRRVFSAGMAAVVCLTFALVVGSWTSTDARRTTSREAGISNEALSTVSLVESTDDAGGTQVLDVGGKGVGIGLTDGSCKKAQGPFTPGSETSTGSLKLWAHDTEHLVCFTTQERASHLLAKPEKALDDAESGEFGFGVGIGVSLRPQLATSAIWQLQAGVESLGVSIANDTSFRALAIRTTKEDQMQSEVPLVVARMRMADWPIDVNFVDKRDGECRPRPGDLSQQRFVCRGKVQAIDTETRLLAFCPKCGNRSGAWRLRVTKDGRHSQASEVKANAPWIGWSTTVPEHNRVEEWTVNVELAGEARLLSSAPTSFQIVLVGGTTSLALEGVYADFRLVAGIGIGLSVVALVSFGVALIAFLVSALRLPGPVVAQLPSLSCSVLALQFFALFGFQTFAPQMQDMSQHCGWILGEVRDPIRMLEVCLAIMGAVMVAHVVALVSFVASNGKGSAAHLPHGLLFGAWELRALPFVAFPAAASASGLATRYYFGVDAWDRDEKFKPSMLYAVFYALLPLVMLLFAFRVVGRLYTLFSEELVAAMPTRSGIVFFVDRVCDQVRSMPCLPDLKCWSKSLGWTSSPPIATMSELSLRGVPNYGPMGSWRTLWSDGPWSGPAAETKSTRTSKAVVHGSLTRRSSSSLKGDDPVIKYELSLSPAINTHPIASAPRFMYKVAKDSGIAGLAGIPWVDAAVPASAVRDVYLAARLTPGSSDGGEGQLTLFVQASQLSGPLTCGRLAACFEWCDRFPYRWPIDLTLRVLLGVYVGVLPYLSILDNSAVQLLPWAVILGGVLLAVAALVGGPYVQTLDNVSMAAASAAVALTAFNVQYLEYITGAAAMSAFVVALVVLLAIPALVLLATSLTLIWWSVVFPRDVNSEEALSGTIDCWAAAVRDSDKHPTRMQVVPMTRKVATAKHDVSRHTMPASLRANIARYEIRLPARPTGPMALPMHQDSLPPLPMPVSLLFSAPGQHNHERKSTMPIAALVSSSKAQLLYEDRKYNNAGINWRDVVEEFCGPDDALAREVTRVVERGSEGLSQDCDSDQNGRPIVVVEITE